MTWKPIDDDAKDGATYLVWLVAPGDNNKQGSPALAYYYRPHYGLPYWCLVEYDSDESDGHITQEVTHYCLITPPGPGA